MNRKFWLRLLLVLAVFVIAQAGAYLVLSVTGLAGKDYSSVLINTVFLVATLGLVRALNLSAEDIGLKIIRGRLLWHVAVCLAIFAVDMAFYLFVVRISGLRPMTTRTMWGLLNYLVVVFAEEITFRGICYSVVQSRYSGRMAVFISGLLFGLAHARQGLGMIPRFFTGWLFGAVRYSSGMIFLLIFPVHFAYNVVWLLFEGNWDHLPWWAQLFPLVELLLGIAIMVAYKWTARRKEGRSPVIDRR